MAVAIRRGGSIPTGLAVTSAAWLPCARPWQGAVGMHAGGVSRWRATIWCYTGQRSGAESNRHAGLEDACDVRRVWRGGRL